MRGLYAIIDVDFLARANVPLLPFAESVFAACPAVVQLRAKHAGARDVVEWLRHLRKLADASRVLLFANDRPDLAVIARCDGVHVGQGDLNPADVRRFAPNLRIGISTHDLSQLDAALRVQPAYVAFGPIFGTASKENPDPVVGIDGLAVAAARCRGKLPLVAIGGIGVESIARVAAHTTVAAAISALLPSEGLAGVKARALKLHECLLAGR